MSTNPWEQKPETHSRSLHEDLKKFIKKRLSKKKGGGFGGFEVIFVLFLVLVFLVTRECIYRVNPGEQAVVLRFGRPDRLMTAGLQFAWPSPVEKVMIRSVTAVNSISSQALIREYGDTGGRAMLTGDENIVEADFTVLWVISDLKNFLFNARNPETTLKSLAESVVRDIVAQMPISEILALARADINRRAQESLQRLADQYGLGIHIQEVMMGAIDPPLQVIDAYRDVQRARADQERAVNEAEADAHQLVFGKRAEANGIIQQAKSEAALVVARAKDATVPFRKLFEQYQRNKKVIADQMRIETLKHITTQKRKIITSGDKPPTVFLTEPRPSNSLQTNETLSKQETEVMASYENGAERE